MRATLGITLERGSGTLATVGVVSAIFGVALLGFGAAGLFLRVNSTIRFAEQVSITVAERLATGSADVCDGLPAGVTECEVDQSSFSATLTVNWLGVVAVSTAGIKPET